MYKIRVLILQHIAPSLTSLTSAISAVINVCALISVMSSGRTPTLIRHCLKEWRRCFKAETQSLLAGRNLFCSSFPGQREDGTHSHIKTRFRNFGLSWPVLAKAFDVDVASY